MPRVLWPLRRGRPCVEVMLSLTPGGQPLPRTVLADTGAGARSSPFQLILDEDDCLLCGGIPLQSVTLRGAYAGSFPIYDLLVRIPALGFDQHVHAVGVPSFPVGLAGIACLAFLDRFTYGNFGNPANSGWSADGSPGTFPTLRRFTSTNVLSLPSCRGYDEQEQCRPGFRSDHLRR